MKRTTRAFVSSTMKDLRKERAAVCEALLMQEVMPVSMEFFPCSNRKPEDFIRFKMSRCDFSILIVGNRYGSKSNGKSFTEMEYDMANELGIPIYVFISDSKSDDSPESEDDIMSLIAFKRRIKEEHTVAFFSNSDDLKAKVLNAVCYEHNDI